MRQAVDELGQTIVMVTHDPVAAGLRRPGRVPRRRPDRRRDARAHGRDGARPHEALRRVVPCASPVRPAEASRRGLRPPAALRRGPHLPRAERHLATLTTLRPDGSPHVVAVGFTWDDDAGLARVITFAPSRKARNVPPAPAAGPRVCQVDGGRWLTLEGTAVVTDDPDRVAEAVRRYAERYRQPGERADRVAIEISVDRVLGRA